MQGITEFIVQFDNTHKDSVSLGGVDIDINPFFEQPKHINRTGKVVSVPLGLDTPIKPGDEVLVVHILLLQEVYQKYGREDSHYLVDKERGWFRFDNNMIVMYRKNKNEKWKCNGINLMVKPIQVSENEKVVNGLTLPDQVFENEQGYKGNKTQHGIIAYGNAKLEEHGIVEGDEVMFKPDREYEFEIDGETYWHMDNLDILMYKKTA